MASLLPQGKSSSNSGSRMPASASFLPDFMAYGSSLAPAQHLTFISLDCFALLPGNHMTDSFHFVWCLFKCPISREASLDTLFEIAGSSLLASFFNVFAPYTNIILPFFLLTWFFYFELLSVLISFLLLISILHYVEIVVIWACGFTFPWEYQICC